MAAREVQGLGFKGCGYRFQGLGFRVHLELLLLGVARGAREQRKWALEGGVRVVQSHLPPRPVLHAF